MDKSRELLHSGNNNQYACMEKRRCFAQRSCTECIRFVLPSQIAAAQSGLAYVSEMLPFLKAAYAEIRFQLLLQTCAEAG